jgi:hypothetical protein
MFITPRMMRGSHKACFAVVNSVAMSTPLPRLGGDVHTLATHPLQRDVGVIQLPAQDEDAGGVRDERDTCHHDGGRGRVTGAHSILGSSTCVVDQVDHDVHDVDELNLHQKPAWVAAFLFLPGETWHC